ncbi:MAG TPA: histidine kinase [Trebonia sp.]|jgi:signal transduction histidine kinase|nr:histidine kinase [Trebonia sp.]
MSDRSGVQGRAGDRAGDTAAGALVQVLIGRDDQPQWRSAARRRLAHEAAWLGWALMALLSLIAVLGGYNGRYGGHSAAGAAGWLTVVLAVSAAVPIAARYALLGWRIGFLGVLVTPLIPGQNHVDTGFYCVLAITYAVAGTRYGPPRLWWMGALTLIPVWLWTPGQPADWAYPLRVTIILAAAAGVLYAAGRWRRDRLALTAAQRQTREQAELARLQGERSAVLEERARIAREMHDVVAHHMSMIAVQAETAPYRLPGLTGPAEQEFAALSQAAREALADMRRLLRVLRNEDNAGERSPQPGLADVPALADTARRAGAEVTLAMPPLDTQVPPAVALTAYRIIQESLSNAGRHAPGAPIRIEIGKGSGTIRVDVVNGAGGTRLVNGNGTGQAGHGLAGMRERVALLGGQLQAGPQYGGFAVRAELPASGALLPTGDA